MSVVLIARDLTRHYSVPRGLFRANARVQALNGVSFELQAGQTLAVVGESGCGKSTLARALTLIEQPSSGSLQIAGQEVLGASRTQRRRTPQPFTPRQGQIGQSHARAFLSPDDHGGRIPEKWLCPNGSRRPGASNRQR